MADTARAYFDTIFSLAGDSGRRAREFAERTRNEMRSGAERVKTEMRSGADQAYGRGSRAASDLRQLIRGEIDATFARLGLATRTDLDDVNLRLENSEDAIRELRRRLAEAEARADNATPPAVAAPAQPPAVEPVEQAEPTDDDNTEPTDEEGR